MYDLIYSLIIFFATFLGAFVGLGGGVIIKPLLDLIGHDSIATVNFISAFAVFSMSISSTIKHIKAKTKIDFKFIITLSIGSVAGGIAGSRLFDYMLTIFDNTDLKRKLSCKKSDRHYSCRPVPWTYRFFFRSWRRSYKCCIPCFILFNVYERFSCLQCWSNFLQSDFKADYNGCYKQHSRV